LNRLKSQEVLGGEYYILNNHKESLHKKTNPKIMKANRNTIYSLGLLSLILLCQIAALANANPLKETSRDLQGETQ